MRQEAFEQRYHSIWSELNDQLNELEKSRFKKRDRDIRRDRLPYLYRQVCNHYALARGRRYSPLLVEQLHQLILRGHQQIYTRKGAWLWRLIAFIAVDFPSSLRAHIRYFLLALALFLVPALLVGGFTSFDANLIYSVLSDGQVSDMEEMYRPDNDSPGRTLERSAESDFTMFGYYIMNNIGIGFRTFAMGILAGIGTVFTLIYNGVVLGGVAGHLTKLGYTDTFWPFVSGHSSLELTAIVICGAAGLMLGHGVLAPGRYRRMDAIKRRAKQALPLVMGAGLMLFIAAFIEGFWSANGMPNIVKYVVGISLWVLMILYFIFAGRRSDGPR